MNEPVLPGPCPHRHLGGCGLLGVETVCSFSGELTRADWPRCSICLDFARSLARIERRGQPQIRLKRAARR